MPDNPELPAEALAIHAAATTLARQTDVAAITIAEALTAIDDDLSLLRRQMFPQRQPRVTPSPTWPWSPGTQNQGFLSNRWERRDGNSYATPALRAAPGPNSPIRGGDDSGKKVDVPSGARRV